MLYADHLKALQGRCPFCQPSQTILAQNAHAFLTYATAPYHKHHLLVIPKAHLESVFQLQYEHYVAIDLMTDLAFDLLRALGYENMVAFTREGTKEGKTVPHLHKHVVPDTLMAPVLPTSTERHTLEPAEEQAISDELQTALATLAR